MKKLLSIVLVLGMLLSIVPPAALASEVEKEFQGDAVQEVEATQERSSAEVFNQFSDVGVTPPETEDEYMLEYERMLEERSKVDRFIVKPRAAAARSAMTALGGEAVAAREALTADGSRPGEYVVVTLEEKVVPEEFIAQVGNSVEFIQPDYELEISAVQDEEAISGERLEVPKAVFDREANLAAAHQVSTGAGVTIALLDTGVDMTHPDLAGHFVDAWNFVDNTDSVTAIGTSIGEAHGTHIAGIIASVAPDANIMPLQVFEYGRAYTSDIVDAIHYAEAHGAQIVNCSWGSSADNQVLREAIEASNILFVTAAGNNRSNLDETPVYPASYDFDNVISVAAVNDDGGMSYFSNYGEGIDIAAWGRDVVSTLPGGGYGEMTGSSMSAGVVSGAAALVCDGMQTSEIKETLKAFADKLDVLDRKTDNGNMLNFFNSVSTIVPGGVTEVDVANDFDVFQAPSPENSWELFLTSAPKQISTGRDHCAVLMTDGTVWTWGKNDWGQLGYGGKDSNIHPYPQQVPGISNIKYISTGANNTVAVKNDGTAWGWGNNASGLFANGTQVSNVTTPTAVGINDLISAEIENDFALYLKSNGTVWVAGNNWCGVFGNGERSSQDIPFAQQITALSNIKQIARGKFHAAALNSRGSVYMWGFPDDEYLVPTLMESGIKEIVCGTYQTIGVSTGGEKVWIWSRNTGASNHNEYLNYNAKQVTGVAAGESHYLILMSDGTVRASGSNRYGQIGNGSIGNPVTTPTQVMMGTADFQVPLTDAVAISSHEDMNLVLTEAGDVLAWGYNGYGQLGDGTTTNRGYALKAGNKIVEVVAPEPLNIEYGVPFESLPLPEEVTVTLDNRILAEVGVAWQPTINYDPYLTNVAQELTGTLVEHGNLFENPSNLTVTLSITVMPPREIISVQSVLPISAEYGTTWNTLISTNMLPSMVEVELDDGTTRLFQVQWDSSSYQPTFVESQQMILGTFAPNPAYINIDSLTITLNITVVPPREIISVQSVPPISVEYSTAWSELISSNKIPAAVEVKLDDGTTRLIQVQWDSTSYQPTLVESQQTIFGTFAPNPVYTNIEIFTVSAYITVQKRRLNYTVEVDAGQNHSLARDRDGNVWAWGDNSYGQLGDGTNIDKLIPQLIPGLTDIKQISAGAFHNLALQSDGTVWEWGRNIGNVPVRVNIGTMAEVSAGLDFSIARGPDGIWSWGVNDKGQLGNGTTSLDISRSAALIPGTLNATSISAGKYHSLAIKSDGTLWGWGYNKAGELGFASETTVVSPYKMDFSGYKGIAVAVAHAGNQISIIKYLYKDLCYLGKWTQSDRAGALSPRNMELSVYPGSPSMISCGDTFNLITCGLGYWWTWGNNSNGQLGNGTTNDSDDLVEVVGEDGSDVSAGSQCSAGGSHALVWENYYAVWTWGDNTYGQLGDGTNLSSYYPIKVGEPRFVSKTTTIAQLDLAYGEQLERLTLPEQVSVGINGGVYISVPVVWDTSNFDETLASTVQTLYGILILPDNITNPAEVKAAIRIRVGDDPSVKTIISVTPSTEIGVKFNTLEKDLKLAERVQVTLQDGTKVQLSVHWDTSTYNPSLTNVLQEFTGSIVVEDVVSNPLGLTATATIIVESPDIIVEVAEVRTVKVRANTSANSLPLPNTIEVRLENGAKMWSAVEWDIESYVPLSNSPQQLTGWLIPPPGLANPEELQPTINITIGTPKFTKVVGTAHTLALDENGMVWAWGFNYYGQLGDGTTINRTTPAVVPHLADVIEIVATGSQSIALRRDGTVWAWGQDSFGLFGNGNKYVPTQVGGLTDVIAIAGSSSHRLALKSDGTVWSWGNNSKGQLGLGNDMITSRDEPSQVAIQNVIAIAAGDNFSVALRRDGLVWTWGDNSKGQLGIESTRPSSSQNPVGAKVFGLYLRDIIAVAAYGEQITALSDNGIVYNWGYTRDGQYSSRPTTKNSLDDVAGITAYKMVLKNDGTVWSWGNNYYGQFGSGGADLGDVSYHDALIQAKGENGVGFLSDVVLVAGSGTHSAAITTDGTLWTWGSNSNGKLGYITLGDTITPRQYTPARVPFLRTISSTKSITPIVVPPSVQVEDLPLPVYVEVTLANGLSAVVPVAWAPKTTYDPTLQDFPQLFTGTILLEGTDILNTKNYKAEVAVTINLQSITSVANPTAISVAYDTPAEDMELPTTVKVMLGDETVMSLPVTWDTTAYNGSLPGVEQILTGSLTLTDGILNPQQLTAQIVVVVGAKPDDRILSVAPQLGITAPLETAQDELALPTTVTVNYTGGSEAVDVVWSGYDPNSSGTQTLTGTLTNLRPHLINSNRLTAQIAVTVTPVWVVDWSVGGWQTPADSITASLYKTAHDPARYSLEVTGNGAGSKAVMDFHAAQPEGWNSYKGNITQVTIGDNITYVGRNMFINCANLTSVSLGADVGCIAAQSFYGCTGLTQITLPASLGEIQSLALAECTALTSIVFLRGASQGLNITAGAFATSVPLATSVGGTNPNINIYNWAADNRTVETVSVAVESVSLDRDAVSLTVGETVLLTATINPANATNQERRWTSADTAVATVSAGGVVTAIGVGETVLTVTTIDGNKTAACAVTVTAPEVGEPELVSAWSIGGWQTAADAVTASLYTVPEQPGKYSLHIEGAGAAMDNPTGWNSYRANIVSVTVGGGVTYLGSAMFKDCTALQDITLAEGLGCIGSQAFANCTAVERITIPASVGEIQGYAFNNCSGLSTIIFLRGAGQPVSIVGTAFYTQYEVPTTLVTENETALAYDWTGNHRPLQ